MDYPTYCPSSLQQQWEAVVLLETDVYHCLLLLDLERKKEREEFYSRSKSNKTLTSFLLFDIRGDEIMKEIEMLCVEGEHDVFVELRFKTAVNLT